MMLRIDTGLNVVYPVLLKARPETKALVSTGLQPAWGSRELLTVLSLQVRTEVLYLLGRSVLLNCSL